MSVQNFFSPSGDRFQPRYGLVINDDGHRSVEQVGEDDIQASIQAACPPTLAELVDQYTKLGGDKNEMYSADNEEVACFFKRTDKGFYADITGLASMDFITLKGVIDGVTRTFGKFSPEVRANVLESPASFNAWLAGSYDGKTAYADYLANAAEKSTGEVKKEEKKDESVGA